jgi:2-(1,2-epoxy-1,2-dihydrophenyl)acetyl-CoA isomerase
MTSDPIIQDREGAVVRVTLNRPHVLNSLDLAMMDALAPLLDQLAGDETVRAVILTGAGAHFMAGGDLRFFKENFLTLEGEARKAVFRELIGRLHQGIVTIARMEKPVIAQVQGSAAGAGLSLMLACDLAIASADSRFTAAYEKIGTTPDGGLTFALPRLVGARKAMEIAMLGETLNAEEALALGLVNKVVPPEALAEETLKIAQRLAAGAARSSAGCKRLIRASFEHDLETQLALERESFAECTLTPDFEEGITAFTEKRTPRFGKA